jgi:hypothetical protein
MLDPCYSKDSFLDHLEDTVENTIEKSEDWTEKQWKEKDEELEKLMDECYEKFKDELTKEERKKVFKESTRYVYHRQKDKLEEFFQVIEDLDLDEEAQRLISLADEEIKEIFNDVLKDDIEGFIDDAVGELEKLAKELKESWEEAKKK